MSESTRRTRSPRLALLALVVAALTGLWLFGKDAPDASPTVAAMAPPTATSVEQRTPAELPAASKDATATTAYDVELRVESRLALPGAAAVLSGGVTLVGVLDITTETTGELRLAFRAGHPHSAVAMILGHELAGSLESGVARVRLAADGSPEAIRLSHGASPLFEHAVTLLVRETFPPRTGPVARDEATPLGRARSTYTFAPTVVRRSRAYQPVLAATGALAGDARLAAQYDALGASSVEVAEQVSSTDGQTFSGSLRARRIRRTEPGVEVADEATPGAPSLQAGPSGATAPGPLTVAALLGRIASERLGTPRDGGAAHARFVWDARSVLASDPDAVRAVEAAARSADVAGRGLALDLLAQSGSPAGQAAFMRLVAESANRGDAGAAADLQRLVLVDGATPETLTSASAFLDATDPTLRRSALYAIGGALHGAVAGDVRQGLIRRVEDALASAPPGEAVHLVAALGNAGAPSSRPALERALAAGDPELAAGAARALRRYDDAAPLLVRQLSGSLDLADAALESLDAIARRDPAVVLQIAAALIAEGLHPALVGEAFGLLKRHAFGEHGPVVVAAIAALAELPGVAATTRGQMRDFVMLAGGGV